MEIVSCGFFFLFFHNRKKGEKEERGESAGDDGWNVDKVFVGSS